MYDAVYLRLETNEQVFNRLTGIKETFDESGFSNYKGFIGNMRIKQDVSGIAIAGSLPKFLYGTNISTFNRQDAQRAIEKLNDELLIDVKSSKVYSLEISSSFIMKYPVGNYLDRLGDISRFKIMTIGDESKDYFNKTKSIKFYDKIIEMKSKKQNIPEFFQGHNVLSLTIILLGSIIFVHY